MSLGDMSDNHGPCTTCIWYSPPYPDRGQYDHDCSEVDSPFHGALDEETVKLGCWAHEGDE